MIDRYLLRYFLAVIDQGNFSRAAQHCRVTQPTLSVGIAKLEGLLDRALFHRSNRRIELTAAGTQFAVHARRIEAEFVAAERAVAAASPARIVRLGIIPTLPSVWIGAALQAAHRADPAGRLEIVEGRARDLRPRLYRGAIDLLLGDIGDTPSPTEPLFEEEYALALSVDHPLADCDGVTAEQVAGEAMIVRRHCEALPDISRFFTTRGVRPFMAARTVNDDRALAYVRAGLGITVMPRCFAGPGIAMPALTGFTRTRRIGLIAGPMAPPAIMADPMVAALAAALRSNGEWSG